MAILFSTASAKDKKRYFCRNVDWSKAAQRTPPGKDAGGTEINRSPCKVAFYAVDIIFFQQHEESARELADSLVQLINLIGSGKKFSILAHFDLIHLLFEKLPLNDLVPCRLKY